MFRGLIAVALMATATSAQAGSPSPQADVQYYKAPGAAAANLPFSIAARVGNVVYLNNQIGNRAGETHVVDGGLEPELATTMANIDEALATAGLTRDDVFKCTVGLTNPAQLAELNRLWPTYFKSDRLPVRNVIGVAFLPLGASVSVECAAAAH